MKTKKLKNEDVNTNDIHNIIFEVIRNKDVWFTIPKIVLFAFKARPGIPWPSTRTWCLIYCEHHSLHYNPIAYLGWGSWQQSVIAGNIYFDLFFILGGPLVVMTICTYIIYNILWISYITLSFFLEGGVRWVQQNGPSPLPYDFEIFQVNACLYATNSTKVKCRTSVIHKKYVF